MTIVLFEGGDFTGKSTQIDLLKTHPDFKHSLFLSYPDYNGKYGSLFRSYLSGEDFLSPQEQALLYTLDFLKDIDIIDEALSENNWVFLDRYYYSMLVYQLLSGASLFQLASIVQNLSLPAPDIIFYLEADIEVVQGRKRDSGKDINDKNIEFQKKVKAMYEKVFALLNELDGSDPTLVRVNTSSKIPEEIHSSITFYLSQF